MIMLLDTSTPVCKLTLIEDGERYTYEWQADRQLAHNLLRWMHDNLKANSATWQSLKGLGVFAGPGSFTGLRIGITVMNTLATSLNVPIVGTVGEQWQQLALQRLHDDENDDIVLPNYQAEANITKQRK